MSYPWAANMAFSLAAAAAAAPLGSGDGAEVGGGRRDGTRQGGEDEAPGAATSHLDFRFFLGGSTVSLDIAKEKR